MTSPRIPAKDTVVTNLVLTLAQHQWLRQHAALRHGETLAGLIRSALADTYGPKGYPPDTIMQGRRLRR